MWLVAKRLIAVVGFSALAFTSSATQGAELVTNGGFEVGDFTGWTQTGMTGFNLVDYGLPHSGTYSAFLGPIDGTSTLSQDLATVAGKQYLVEFWLQNYDGGTTTYFSWSWNGAMQDPELTDSGMDTDFVKYGATLTATDASTTLSFTFQHDPAFWVFDDVSVTELGGNGGDNNVPEPGTLLLLGSALAAAGLMRRRQ